METRLSYRALDKEVLAVAVIHENTGAIFDWAVYIGSVKGINHENEKEKVAKSGAKQLKAIAIFLFPYLPEELYRE